MGFRAIVVDRDAEGRTTRRSARSGLDDLPDGEVTVAVEYSTLNYKDGLCLGPGARAGAPVSARARGRLRRAGRGVVGPALPAGRPGGADRLAGRRGALGRLRAEGAGQGRLAGAAARGPDARQAMAIGTAGLTAMLAVMALEEHGLAPVARAGAGDRRGRRGRVGGGGGAGAARLRGRGGDRAAGDRGLPARARGERGSCRAAELAEPAARALESETWAGCVDAVGGAVLARVTQAAQVRCAAAAVGNAGGADVPLSIIPFLLRGVSLLGIDSVLQPYASRQEAWARLVRDLDLELSRRWCGRRRWPTCRRSG